MKPPTLAFRILRAIRFYIDILIDKIFGFYYTYFYIKGPKGDFKIPRPTNPICLLSVTELVHKIQDASLTPTEVVQAFIERIKEVNPFLNALVDDCFEEALKEADRQTEDLRTLQFSSLKPNSNYINPQKPLLGIPFTVKESTAATNQSHTFGLKSRSNRKANFDADVVKIMKEAGAILVGVTNIPQLNLWIETSNPIFGRTNNPLDLRRNVGGSSGGEAALVAAYGVPVGIGSDIGGSLRIPAFMCGVFSHKPTCGVISTCGLTFRTGKEGETMVVAGPITKTVDDLNLVMKVLSAEKKDKLKLQHFGGYFHNLKDPFDAIPGLKVYYARDAMDPIVSPMRYEMCNQLNKVFSYFENNCKETKEVYFDEFAVGGKLWRYWMTQEPNFCFARDITNRQTVAKPLLEIFKYFCGYREFTLAVIFNLINGLLPPVNEQWARTQTDNLKKKLLELLGDDGVLLYPSAPFPASFHNAVYLRAWNFNYFAIWNALKFPVTQVPLYGENQEMPGGIQVVAAPGNDHVALAVAHKISQVFTCGSPLKFMYDKENAKFLPKQNITD